MDEFEKEMTAKIDSCKKDIKAKNCDEIEKTILISQMEAYYDSLLSHKRYITKQSKILKVLKKFFKYHPRKVSLLHFCEDAENGEDVEKWVND